jgi:hypothetical protein
MCKCKLCQNDLSNGAKKCPSCGEFQGLFMRAVANGNIFLALLLSLVAVISVAVPPAYKYIGPKYDDVQMHYLDMDQRTSHLAVLAQNNGNRSAYIKEAYFIPSLDTTNRSGRPMQKLTMAGSREIRPNSRFEVVFMAKAGSLPPPKELIEEPGVYTLKIVVIRHGGEQVSHELLIEAGI